MTDEPTNPGPDLEPTPALPEGAAGPEVTGATPPPAAAGIPTTETTEMAAATPPGAPPPKRPSWKTWVAVAGGAVVVGAAAVFGISAATSSGSSTADAASQQPATSNSVPNGYGQGGSSQQGRFGRRPGAFGTIKSIDGSTLTVSDQRQSSTTKVKTTAKTKVTTTEKGSLDDVNVGDTVMVVGTQSGSSTAATRVTDDGKVSASDRRGPGAGQGFNPPQGGEGGQGFTPPQGGQGFNGPPPGANGDGGPPGGFPGNGGSGASGTNGMAFIRGEVQSVSDGSFTVKGIDGSTATVTTSSSTEFSITKAGRVSDLKVGDSIVATGQTKDGVVTATMIREGGMAGGFFRRGQGFPGGPNGSSGTSGSSGSTSSSGAGPQ